MRITFLLCLIFPIYLCGCPHVQHIPTKLHIKGIYVHSGSGIVFPECVGEFRRVSIIQYDANAEDVSAMYILSPTNRIAITVYVYSGPSVWVMPWTPETTVEGMKAYLLKCDFEGVKQEIISSYKGVQLDNEGTTSIEKNGVIHYGLKATFEIEDFFLMPAETAESQALLFTFGKWFVKYRISYGIKSREFYVNAYKKFLNDFQWGP